MLLVFVPLAPLLLEAILLFTLHNFKKTKQKGVCRGLRDFAGRMIVICVTNTALHVFDVTFENVGVSSERWGDSSLFMGINIEFGFLIISLQLSFGSSRYERKLTLDFINCCLNEFFVGYL